jgi:hypothetical protein
MGTKLINPSLLKAVMILLCMAWHCIPAQAQLGAASITLPPLENSPFTLASRVSSTPTYVVNTLITRENVELHEYVNTQGKVFAYYWVGTSKPDLLSFLGVYGQRYQAALALVSSGRSPVMVNDADFVLQTGGRMNRFWGSAFLPKLAPAGLALSDIK